MREAGSVDAPPSLYLPVAQNAMAIWNAFGLAIGIIVLRVYAPDLWDAVEHVALSVLASLGMLADQMQAAVGASTLLPPTF